MLTRLQMTAEDLEARTQAAQATLAKDPRQNAEEMLDNQLIPMLSHMIMIKYEKNDVEE